MVRPQIIVSVIVCTVVIFLLIQQSYDNEKFFQEVCSHEVDDTVWKALWKLSIVFNISAQCWIFRCWFDIYIFFTDAAGFIWNRWRNTYLDGCLNDVFMFLSIEAWKMIQWSVVQHTPFYDCFALLIKFLAIFMKITRNFDGFYDVLTVFNFLTILVKILSISWILWLGLLYDVSINF